MSSDAFGTSGLILPLLVTGGVDPQVSTSLAEATQRLGAADAAAKSMSNAWTETKAKIDIAAASFQRLVGFADQIATLTAEQQQLTAASQRLGLDFNQAADGAGRFVDETEAMAAASRLAEAGLHLTQEELNQLTARAAIASQRLGVDTTTAFNMLTTAIESGSTRALRPFGEDMVRLGGSTHSAEERLSAFTTTTRGMERATDDASTSMARLRDSIGDAEREMATSFSAELLRLATISERTTAIGTQMDDSADKLRGFGTMAATAVASALNGIAVVVGAVAYGITRTVNQAQGAIAGLRSLAHGGSFSDAYNGALGSDSASAEVLRFLEGRVNALEALSDDNGSTAGRGAVRGLIPGAGGGRAPSGDMVFGESQADADDAFAAAHRRHRQSGGNARARRQAADEMGVAIQQKINNREALVQQTQIELNRPEYEAQMAERRAELERVNREGSHETAIENTARGKRPGTDDTISGRLSTQMRQYGDTTRHVRDQVVSAMSDMTEAVATHFEAWTKGREGFAAAAQGMLSDFLGTVAKRASVSAAEESAAALASLAVYNFPGAGLHAAAAAGFGVVAGLAGAAASAVAPTPAAPAGGASGAAGRAMSPTSTSDRKGDGGGSVVNVYFGGPVIGAGGARQAAREVVGLLNDGARQGDVRLAPQLMPMGSR